MAAGKPAARARFAVHASYDAASTSIRTSQLRQTTSLNAALYGKNGVIKNRSIAMARNDGFIFGAIEGLIAEVIGTGIKIRSACPDEDVQRTLTKAFADYALECDARGRQTLYDMQATALRDMFYQGSALARMRVRRIEDGLVVPMAIELLNLNYLAIGKNGKNGARPIINGIEYDPLNRAAAFHFYKAAVGDPGVIDATKETVAVPASDVAHMYVQLDADQRMGEPLLARALTKAADLHYYDDAELNRKKNAAGLQGFFQKSKSDAENPYAEATDADGDGEDDVDEFGSQLLSFGPNSMLELPDGLEFKQVAPTEVGNSYKDFMHQQLLSLAIAVGTLYEYMSGDYSGVNDRTLRVALQHLRRRLRALQMNVIGHQFLRPIWIRFVDYAVATGMIQVPAGMTMRDLYRCKFSPAAWGYIHPVQEIQATKEAIKAGVMSRTEAAAERGIDIEELDEEIAADNARADRLGLVFDTDQRYEFDHQATIPTDGAGDQPDPNQN